MDKKRILPVATVLVFAVIVGFCSAFLSCSKEKGGGRTDGKDKTVRLRYSYWGSPEIKAITDELIRRFETKHPRIKIVQEVINRGYLEKLLTEFATNSAPDVVVTEIVFFKQFVAKGVLLDLTPYVSRDDDIPVEDFQKIVLDEFTWQNRIYSIPFGVGTGVLFYNKKLLREAGLAYPPNTWENDWWDWDTFLDYAKKLSKDTDGDGRNDQFGVVTDRNIWDVEMWVYQNKGEVMTEDGSKCVIDTQEAIEAVQFLADLSLKHHVAPTQNQVTTFGSTNYQMFEMGKAAMFPSGFWRIGEFSKIEGLEFGIAPLPKGKVKATGWHAAGLSISKNTKYPKESWEFVKYCVMPEAQLLLSQAGLQVPSRISVANSREFLDAEIIPDDATLFNEGFQYAKRYPAIYDDPEIQDIIIQQLDLAWEGTVEVPEVCKKVAELINERIGNRAK